MTGAYRLSVDIGGTFTDFALAAPNGEILAHKQLTTHAAPDEGVLSGIVHLLKHAGISEGAVASVVHGTTLATNALIERKGACTAMIVTDGFRDALEIAYENRFDQYNLYIEKPRPIVPRQLRLPVRERIDARGRIVDALSEADISAAARVLAERGVESVAICFLNSYVNVAHEKRAADILRARIPKLWITMSGEVSPELREYDRWSTAVANAYVQPIMAGYLGRLQTRLRERGLNCPFYLMTSGGGVTSVETASAFPIRLVESGPAGGAVLASTISTRSGLDKVISFDMGGTTAKLCLIDQGTPEHSRVFEIARQFRFLKGSGLPVRIPVIEMVEIGAGGGSQVGVDAMSRITVGPESAGSEPGPACYGRGGTRATVTDADLILGHIDPQGFAGGTVELSTEQAEMAIRDTVASRLDLSVLRSARGIAEIVDENMSNAARVHAAERGCELESRTLIAFGGAAPLHAARVAEKLGIRRIVIPRHAGIGSAIGFLLAPVAYEIVQSRLIRLDGSYREAEVAGLRAQMYAAAAAVVRDIAPDDPLTESWKCDMRYSGQGHEVTVNLPQQAEPLSSQRLQTLFLERYEELFGRTIPGHAIEITTWSVSVSVGGAQGEFLKHSPAPRGSGMPSRYCPVASDSGDHQMAVPVYDRSALLGAAAISGPAIIIEAETSTVVTRNFSAEIDRFGNIVLKRQPEVQQ